MSDRDADTTYPTHPHGYSVRVHLHGSTSRTAAALLALGWPDKRRWHDTTTNVGGHRYVRTGSVWLSGRAPRNPRLSMAKLNAQWGTRLYGIGFEIGENGDLRLDLVGVRRDDIQVVVEDILRHDTADYHIDNYRQIERFAVLSSPAAHRLSGFLGGMLERGKGPLNRKEFLLRDHQVQVKVRSFARVTGLVSVYRIVGGATGVWKAEIVVKRRANQGGGLLEADDAVVDRVLRNVLAEAGVEGIEKPLLWEPVDPDDNWHNAPGLRQLRTWEYRGKKPGRATRKGLHTLEEIRWALNARHDGHSDPAGWDVGVSSSHPPLHHPPKAVEQVIPLHDPPSASPTTRPPSLEANVDDGDENVDDVDAILRLAGLDREHDRLEDSGEREDDGDPDVFTFFGDQPPGPPDGLEPDRLLPSTELRDLMDATPDVSTWAVGPPQASANAQGVSLFSCSPCLPRPDVHRPAPARRLLLSDFPVSEEELRVRTTRGPEPEPEWLRSLADDIHDLPDGFISEVVLPTDFLFVRVAEALVTRVGGGVAVAYVGPIDEIEYPLAELMITRRLPDEQEPELLVVVVDPLVPLRYFHEVVADLRAHLEVQGGRVVFVTADRRKGNSSYVAPRHDLYSGVSDLWYYANQRYRVEVGVGGEAVGVDVIKDERHGRSGRRLWARFRSRVVVPLGEYVDLAL